MSKVPEGDHLEALKAHNASSLSVVGAIALFFVPAFWALDWVILPEWIAGRNRVEIGKSP